MILTLYRLAWEPVWWTARALAAAMRLTGRESGRDPGRDSRARGLASWRLSERLAPTVPPASSGEAAPETIWLHAASLGECKGLWAVAQQLQQRAAEVMREGTPAKASPSGREDHAEDAADAEGPPETLRTLRDMRLLLTTNTVTGLAYLQREIAALSGSGDPRDSAPRVTFAARLAPLDHPRLARAFLAENAIRALVLFEVELWPHWIAAARRAGVPVLWISARLTPRARRRYAGNSLCAGALGRVLRDLTWIQTQTEDEEHALRRLGNPRVETGGDLRGLHSLRPLHSPRAVPSPGCAPADQPPLPDTPGVRRGGIAFVSFHAHELPALVAAVRMEGDERDAHPHARLLIFPRKLNEVPTFVRMLSPYGFVLYSEHVKPGERRGTEEPTRETSAPEAGRMIIDAYGLVDGYLAQTRTAVIGGSFGADARIGGHNAWEPLRAGCRMIIGPHHHNQRALVDRLQSGGLIRVARDDAELREEILRATRAESFLTPSQSLSEKAAQRAFVDEETARLETASARACDMILACARGDS